MKVKPGYKLTEVGIIPESWDLKTLGSLTSLLTNGFVGTATSAYVNSDDGVLYIQGYNVKENGFNFHGIKRVSKSFHARNQKSCLQPGDLLTIQTGDIGVTTVVPPELAGANCHALIISRLNKRISEPRFYCQYFNSERGRAAFKEIETGTTMKHLNCGDMKQLFLPSPPVEEQRSIATVLSDMDALLRSLDQLIAKKRDLKQATMQQLLTGKKRLPGFGEGKGYQQTEIGLIPEDWGFKPLSDLIDSLEAGVSVNSVEEDNNKHGQEQSVLKTSSVSNGKFFPNECKKIIPKDIYRAKLNPQANTIIISRMNTPVLVGECGYVGNDYNNLFLPDRLWITRFKKDILVNARWLSFILSYSNFKKAIKDTATGTSGSMKNIAKDAFLQIVVPYPKEEEQTAIANVLSDMDTELAALEQRRDKTRALKQGIMQELLTGKVRLL